MKIINHNLTGNVGLALIIVWGDFSGLIAFDGTNEFLTYSSNVVTIGSSKNLPIGTIGTGTITSLTTTSLFASDATSSSKVAAGQYIEYEIEIEE